MSDIPSSLQAEVVLRSGNRCEYCRLSQLGQEATFHIDHVIPRAAAGPTTADNLALACVSWIQHSYCLLFELVRIHEYSPSSSRCAIAA